MRSASLRIWVVSSVEMVTLSRRYAVVHIASRYGHIPGRCRFHSTYLCLTPSFVTCRPSAPKSEAVSKSVAASKPAATAKPAPAATHVYVVTYLNEALCGCGSDSGTLGTFSDARAARAAARKGADYRYSQDALKECFVGGGSFPKAYAAFMSGDPSADALFNLSAFDGEENEMSETWNEDGSGRIMVCEPMEGCGSANYSAKVQRVKLQ